MTAFRQLNWSVRGDGDLFLASQFPIVSTDRIVNDEGWRVIAARYELKAPFGRLHLVNLHLDTPRQALELVRHPDRHLGEYLQETIDVRRRQSQKVAAWVPNYWMDVPLLVLGDFNLPPESKIFREYWGGYEDAFASAGNGYGYTKFTRWWGARIDHLLAGPGWRVTGCRVGPDVGSDHRPLLTTLQWMGAG